MEFIGRQRELAAFAAFFANEQANLALVYGRRRIGKSVLIRHALGISASRYIFLECQQTSALDNVRNLAKLGSDRLGLPGISAETLEDLLSFLAGQALDEPLIVVLDEYPYLRDLLKGCDSILQAFLDRWKGRSKLKLILCGSYIDVMKGVLEYKSPLYGRTSLVIALGPLDYVEASEFYPDASNEDKVRYFSIFGGVPYYNRLIDPDLDVRRNILRLLKFDAAILSNEIGMFLRAELSKLNNANMVLNEIAQGTEKYSDILAKTSVKTSPSLADILMRLISMGLLEKTVPINDEGNQKRARYQIADPLANFYYRYVFKHSSSLQVLNENDFYEYFVKDDFETRNVPKAFEKICSSFLIRRNKAGLIKPPFLKIGRYYYDLPKEKKNGEFDVVTLDPVGYAFYEVKFRNKPLSLDQIETEISQVKASPLKAERFGFFSRSGFSEEAAARKDLILYTLDDLYAALP